MFDLQTVGMNRNKVNGDVRESTRKAKRRDSLDIASAGGNAGNSGKHLEAPTVFSSTQALNTASRGPLPAAKVTN
jgi:hypothetical protein